MGIFSDLEYPDNSNRANRATQLVADADNLAYTLQLDKEIVSSKLSEANDVIKKAYGGLIPGGVPIEDVTIADSTVGDWVDAVAGVIIPVVTLPAASAALTNAYKAFLVNEGRLGEAAFADVIGLPVWVRLGSFTGGAAAATAATLAVEAIIDAISGAVQRDKLRDAIHDMIEPRIKLKHNVMISEKVKDTLTAVIMSFNAIAGAGMDKSTLDKIAQSLVDQNKINIDAITIDAAKTALADYDKGRKAWINEDD
jgi:hypothetical protein